MPGEQRELLHFFEEKHCEGCKEERAADGPNQEFRLERPDFL